ncbi:SGNH/GDSL hydrolase family protein [Methylobacterium sp. J-030]|uniref:SGNH/GDSL hydrolase family protein n=1 Tax=Methylobacterium sp. J-030 TaxID=2836627 RepID=UPI001FB9D6D1|nr:SGNH/GDSL hydrolase family protein [Methylobacterium sp. J-030]MCJ2073261.1 SGNH/GDSL hydrolase family protein [Methylobacterium sp. J-030]
MRAPWFETVARRWHHGRLVGRHQAVRFPEIRAALRAATPDSVLLAGNSHAEYIGTPDLGGRPSLNIAVGGSTAADCAKHLKDLHRTVLHRADRRVPVRCAASVLIIGTNDIMGWRHPERPRSADRFAAEVRRILGFLEAWSAQVFVAAIPPVGAWATGRDPAAVAVFSDRLAALCAERGHGFIDPFAALRAGTGGLAGSGLYRDGVHLADYTRLAAEVARLAVIDPVPSRPPASQPARRTVAPNPAVHLRVLRAAWTGRP